MKNDNNKNILKSSSFTLIELIIVLAIISILVTILIATIKPTEIFKKARDSKRIADLKNIEKTIDLLYSTYPNFNELNYASTNIVYISLKDNSPTCSSYISQLPSLPPGYQYRCSANPQNIDGTGWIPIPFKNFDIINLANLPIDPINKPPYYYTFVVGGSYAVYTMLEDLKNQASKNDGDNYPYLYSVGTNKRLIDQAQGLVGYWTFDEGTGTIAYDYSGNGNNGTLVNGPTWTTGKVGGALSFDGIDDLVNVSDTDSLDLTNKGAISFWLYVPSWGSNYAPIIMKGTPSLGWCSNAYNPFHIFNHYTANYIPFSMCSATAINYVVISPRPSTGIWHFYVYTFDGSYLKAYLDGVMVSSVTQTISMKVDSNPVRIGGGNVYFGGTIDDVRIYNRALSDSEIKALYDATK
jgi:prepilin-type N-terminal cleavage/methylation domain-containing protein